MPSLRDVVARLRSAHGMIYSGAVDKNELLPSGRWLIDHMPRVGEIADRTMRALADTKRLPSTGFAPYRRLPRVCMLAEELVAHSDGTLSLDRITGFLEAYQATRPLTMGELWALPLALRAALLSALTGAACIAEATQSQRRAADAWVASVLGDQGEEPRACTAAPVPLGPAFIERCAARLREEGASSETMAWLQDRLRERDMQLDRVIASEHRLQARYGMLMGNAIQSLLWLESLDWSPAFEDLSPVDRLLSGDPAGIYGRMDFDSRDQMRAAVRRIAQKAGVTESHVARHAVACARDAAKGANAEGKASLERRSHIGWYLCDEGIDELWASLGGVPLSARAALWLRRHARGLFVGFNFAAGNLLLFAACAIAARPFVDSGMHALLAGSLVGTLLSVPMQTLIFWLCTRLTARFIRPKKLMRLDVDCLPEGNRAAVVVPALLMSPEQAARTVLSLERHYLANRVPGMLFGLIGDFAESAWERASSDESVIRAASEAVERLNREHGEVFFYLHRPRVYAERGGQRGVWRGWERKRGALLQFNQWLLTGETAFLCAPERERFLGVTHVLTLDADTVLPPGSALKLLGAALHPLNRPETIDGKRVGSAVIAPRVATPISSLKTRVQRLFSGEWGMDSYSGAVSEMYQDLCGEGIFSGKGIYDVAAFHAATLGAFPENAILSHDLIEGLYAGAALANDVQVFDAHPASSKSWAMRKHRWMRGDWQLLPWLFAFVPNRRRKMQPTSLNLFDCFKIYDNLRRSLVAPACALCLLVAAAANVPALGVLALLLTFFEALFYLLGAWRRERRADAGIALRRLGVQIALLAFDGALAVDAILRTVFRLLRHGNLLEWTTAADAERTTGRDELRRMKAWSIVCGILLAVACTLSGGWNLIFLPVGMSWLLTPWLLKRLNEPFTEERPWSDEDRAFLLDIARRTWRCFEHLVTEDDLFLPPDNLQLEPKRGVARRTSPTNIGMYLASCCGAWLLELIDRHELVSRVDATVASIERLPHWNGHLYNWISTADGSALAPRYVSSVDSGNYVACLWLTAEILKQAREEGAGDELLAQRAAHLCQRVMQLANRVDFTPLYDEKRRLFAIGYDAERGQRSDSHYDLLASESRLLSIVAIAKGQAPARHFFALGRMMGQGMDRPVLLSWSGTMFEYLLPSLFLEEPAGTLLGDSCRTAVATQRAAADALPWGVSESGYCSYDLQLNYQYHAFGCMQLALKGGLSEDHVIAPYASALALGVDPHAAIENLRAMERLGWLGALGYYEAVDATPSRIDGAPWRVVKSHMSHHQGMIMMALCNALKGRALQRAVMAMPGVAAHMPLLEERAPRERLLRRRARPAEPPRPLPRRLIFHAARSSLLPETHLLAGGGTLLACTARGPALLSAGGIMGNRFRGDLLDDRWGLNFMLCDAARDDTWYVCGRHYAVSRLPDAGGDSCPPEAVFEPDRAVWRTRHSDVQTELTAYVSPEDGVAVCSLLVCNLSDETRELTATSFFEAALARLEADRAHPAFMNLFIEAQAFPEQGGLLLTRRPRDGGQPLFLLHTLSVSEGEASGAFSAEARRDAFFTRDGGVAHTFGSLAGIDGAVIDPCSATRRGFLLSPGESARITVTLGFCETRDAVAEALRERTSSQYPQRVSAMASTYAQVELGYLGMGRQQFKAWNQAAAWALFFGMPAGERHHYLEETRLSVRALWRLGISGDLPLIVARVRDASHLPLAREVIRMHEFWRMKGLSADLVLIHEGDSDYLRPLRGALLESLEHSGAANRASRPGGVWILDNKDLPDEERGLLIALACLFFEGSVSVAEHIARLAQTPAYPAGFVASAGPVKDVRLDLPAPEIVVPMGIGGFTREGYLIPAYSAQLPAPWSNILANPAFGTLVTERSFGFTWAGNAHEKKLTPWSNDPLFDPPGEIIWLRDEESGAAAVLPSRAEDGAVEHIPGASCYTSSALGLAVRATVHVDERLPIKCVTLELENPGRRERSVSALYCAQWVLGAHREEKSRPIVTGFEEDASLLWASRPGSDGLAWAACPGRKVEASGDRLEILGGEGAVARARLSGRVGAGLDPCAALRVVCIVPPKGKATLSFLLGWEEGALNDALRSARSFVPKDSLERALAQWNRRMERVIVRTADARMDALLSRWLPYQAFVSRFWGRAGFYQAGGAIGFRDQLQDCLLLVHYEPAMVRSHILACAAHQFIEGDVQHWWHPPRHGVRTRISDDLLWLPYVLCDYVRITGDHSILEERVPYLSAPPLAPGQEDAYSSPDISEHSGTVMEHALRAVERACAFGEHGLPLIGGGDWNDAMNRVGIEGRGESVWLGWFLIAVIRALTPLLREGGLDDKADELRACAAELSAALERHGWDGAWYRRAFHDAGYVIGSSASDEARIDCIAQAWAVISGAAHPRRARAAMNAVEKHLWNKDEGILRLLWPPFTEDEQATPGYIKGYAAGVRENGGQYTHGALWAVMAYAMLGDADRAMALLRQLLPTSHADTPEKAQIYRLEPYVAAADIYAREPNVGRGGWSWYTGSAAWMARIALEWLLGYRREGELVTMAPCLPKDWPEIEVTIRVGASAWTLKARGSGGAPRVTLDGRPHEGAWIRVYDDGASHEAYFDREQTAIRQNA